MPVTAPEFVLQSSCHRHGTYLDSQRIAQKPKPQLALGQGILTTKEFELWQAATTAPIFLPNNLSAKEAPRQPHWGGLTM